MEDVKQEYKLVHENGIWRLEHIGGFLIHTKLSPHKRSWAISCRDIISIGVDIVADGVYAIKIAMAGPLDDRTNTVISIPDDDWDTIIAVAQKINAYRP